MQRCQRSESWPRLALMKLISILLTLLTLLIPVSADEPKASLPVITLPVRVHLMQSGAIPAMKTTLTEVDVKRVFSKVNKVWAAAGIQFEIESIVATEAIPLRKDQLLLGEYERVGAMIPPDRLSTTAINVCYVKAVQPNGFFNGKLIVVKDTAALKEVPGGIDEPLPRVTSHELGHALGLPHRQETTNLMQSGTTGFSLNETEIIKAREHAVKREAKAAPSKS
jgi:hypothetical protein